MAYIPFTSCNVDVYTVIRQLIGCMKGIKMLSIITHAWFNNFEDIATCYMLQMVINGFFVYAVKYPIHKQIQ